jgi:transaldolase
MGVSIWLDDLSRRGLATGSLADLVAHDHVVAVTTNPTIFAKAIAGGDGHCGPRPRSRTLRQLRETHPTEESGK